MQYPGVSLTGMDTSLLLPVIVSDILRRSDSEFFLEKTPEMPQIVEAAFIRGVGDRASLLLKQTYGVVEPYFLDELVAGDPRKPLYLAVEGAVGHVHPVEYERQVKLRAGDVVFHDLRECLEKLAVEPAEGGELRKRG